MTVKAKLPQPPEFPASNASYNKIVDKMHKAALNAATSEAAIVAVCMCKEAVTGTNTYAKASRRYADTLLTALGVPAEAAPAVAEGVAKAKKAPAKKAPAKEIVTVVGKAFSNKSNAKRALAKAQLDHLPVEWTPGDNGTFVPVLLVTNKTGLKYAAERGFAAKVGK